MGIQTQFTKLKENWLLVLLVVVLLAVPSFMGGSTNVAKSFGGYAMEEMAMDGFAPSRSYQADFAPQIEERKITTTSSLQTEVDKGDFKNTEIKLKAIVKATDSIILNENVNTYDDVRSGSYSIKVESSKYDAIVTQLKELGDITSFNENKHDITGSYTNNQVELEVERKRLARYQQIYSEATDVNDKLNINDRIFDQERRIKYLEDSLQNKDQRVDYTTISVSISEKRSEYAHIAFVKLSELVRSVVDSVSSVLTLLFVALPYAVIAWLVWFVYRRVKK
ncbi:TPA: DUF4349 domain-containing protein [Candidatus Woesearchaeota archaeon]|nr:hypothetical protein [archaeon]HIJ11808.1 DUF4349 domain-containing protein [Candidatus Woesearchaeota archaeon]|tara:strand:+ start:389 stop:1228 length:840 start_codon:yes stop_codon:yes gene_type:complete